MCSIRAENSERAFQKIYAAIYVQNSQSSTPKPMAKGVKAMQASQMQTESAAGQVTLAVTDHDDIAAPPLAPVRWRASPHRKPPQWAVVCVCVCWHDQSLHGVTPHRHTVFFVFLSFLFFLSAFLTLFRERQPPNGGCREPYLAEYDPSRRTTRDGRTDKKSFEKPYFS